MDQPRNRGLKRRSEMPKTLPRSAHPTSGHPCLLSDLAASSRGRHSAVFSLYKLGLGAGRWVPFMGLESTSDGSLAVQFSMWLKKPEPRSYITLRVKGPRASSLKTQLQTQAGSRCHHSWRGKAIRSSILAWETPWTEDGLQSMRDRKSWTQLEGLNQPPPFRYH